MLQNMTQVFTLYDTGVNPCYAELFYETLAFYTI